MIYAHDLLDCLKWIKKAVGKNEARKNLMNIEFRKTGNKLRILSADAFKIFVEYFKVDEGEDDYCFCADGKFVSETELYLKLCAGTKKEQGWNPRKVSIWVHDTTKVACISIHDFGSRVIKTIDTEFPNLDKLVNENSKTELPDGRICLNADNVKLAMSGFETPVFEFRGEVKLCVIKDQHSTRKAIIMPIKIK